MKRPTRKVFVSVVGIAFIMMLIAGCDEENLSNTKKSRLIANENRQLKSELEQCQTEFKKQKVQLEQCLQKKETLEGQMNEEIGRQVSDIFTVFGDLDKEMREENESLKAQVEQLNARIKLLEEELQKLKEPAEPEPL
jgi:outer membrane murein-binding lipoprotein Lpp